MSGKAAISPAFGRRMGNDPTDITEQYTGCGSPDAMTRTKIMILPSGYLNRKGRPAISMGGG